MSNTIASRSGSQPSGSLASGSLASASTDAGVAQPVLLRQQDDHIAILTLNRPQTRNALSEAMLDALTKAIEDIRTDGDIRAVVLAAIGPAFCAGHDLKELTDRRADADGGRAYFADIMGRCARLMQAIVRCPKPVIAAVEATAMAAGCQLVATCDLAVAADTARFSTPGVNIGLFCSTPMVALTRNVSRKRAMEMLLLGELLSARDACAYGLVNRVVPPGRAMDEAMGMARTIAQKSAATVAIGKQTFYAQIEEGLSEAYNLAANVMVENMMFADANEGIGAFIERRTPEWKGR